MKRFILMMLGFFPVLWLHCLPCTTAGTVNYTYDDAGRLTTALYDGKEITYKYDKRGNLLQRRIADTLKPDGDVAPLGNPDGTVNVGDALVALRFALTLETPTQEDIAHCDVAPLDALNKPNPDGVINVGDALVILRKALGIISF
jgi:YD repeat-containing protein